MAESFAGGSGETCGPEEKDQKDHVEQPGSGAWRTILEYWISAFTWNWKSYRIEVAALVLQSWPRLHGICQLWTSWLEPLEIIRSQPEESESIHIHQCFRQIYKISPIAMVLSVFLSLCVSVCYNHSHSENQKCKNDICRFLHSSSNDLNAKIVLHDLDILSEGKIINCNISEIARASAKCVGVFYRFWRLPSNDVNSKK